MAEVTSEVWGSKDNDSGNTVLLYKLIGGIHTITIYRHDYTVPIKIDCPTLDEARKVWTKARNQLRRKGMVKKGSQTYDVYDRWKDKDREP